ncbi:UNVERIFIED_CONTAM: Aspartyl protease AED3 [Sesamum radiatum]|uniref:Aspartyl protease AED3 n=1 Tax=Sesamum radiatum TaxID=300843 RepID=A0AAW2VIZ1_SESRA
MKKALHLFSLATLLMLSLAQALFTPKTNIKIYHANTLLISLFSPTTQLSWEHTVLQMQSNDNARLYYLSSLASARPIVPIAAGMTITHNPSYIVKARIGTPPQTLLMAVDTGNDASWIPCTGCVGCSAASFNSAKSSTFRTVPCDATQCSQVPVQAAEAPCGFKLLLLRGGGGLVPSCRQTAPRQPCAGQLPAGYTFGCIQTANGTSLPPQGLLGLGRGPLSLTSQASELYQLTFSYCLPNLKNERRSSLYYANLSAIKVGGRVVCIPPTALAFNASTGGGTFFDSGTMFTSLVKPAYTAVRDELRRRMGNATVSSLGGFDTCYTVPIVVTTITFMFPDMNVTLHQDNFLIRSSYGTTSCLAMMAAPDNVDSEVNIIGSFQQQNQRIVIDELNSRVCVSRESCSKLVPRLPVRPKTFNAHH